MFAQAPASSQKSCEDTSKSVFKQTDPSSEETREVTSTQTSKTKVDVNSIVSFLKPISEINSMEGNEGKDIVKDKKDAYLIKSDTSNNISSFFRKSNNVKNDPCVMPSCRSGDNDEDRSITDNDIEEQTDILLKDNSMKSDSDYRNERRISDIDDNKKSLEKISHVGLKGFFARKQTQNCPIEQDELKDLKTSANVSAICDSNNTRPECDTYQSNPQHVEYGDEILIATNSLNACDSEVEHSEQRPSEDFMQCEKCAKLILVWEMPEHMDFHYASQLQKDLNTQILSVSNTNSIKRKNSPQARQGAKKQKVSNSQGRLDFFFTKNS